MEKIFHLLLLIPFFGFGQNYLNTKLSDKYDLSISVEEKAGEEKGHPERWLYVKAIIKVTKKAQDIIIRAGVLYDRSFTDHSGSMSYRTSFNINRQIVDNDHGDIIVADLNFDRQDDLAIKWEEGGNGGPLYNYYLQDKNGKFIINDFLSKEMIFFQTEINAKKQTLTTLVHASAYSVSETVYKLDPRPGRWKQISHRFIGGKKISYII